MNTIQIPKDYFLELTKKEYYDYKSRLWQELTQNSIDAGATEISIEITNNSFTCRDNGRGMNKQRMVDAMLTFGGSFKDENSTGAFGHAKIAILFAHKNYTIHSLDTKVFGEVLTYNFVDCEFYQGTTISCEFNDGWGHEKHEAVAKLQNFLGQCCFKDCLVFINDELFDSYFSLPTSREDETMAICMSDEKKPKGKYISVRKNGLFMFSRFVSNLEYDTIFEIKTNSLDSFTQNRDGLKGEISVKFDNLVSELTIDNLSFKRTGLIKHYYRGKKSFISQVSKVIEKFETPEEIRECLVLATRAASQNVIENIRDLNNYLYRTGASQETINVISKTIQDEPCQTLDNDFLIDLSNSNYDDVPWEFHPATMNNKNKEIALLWKHCLMKALEYTNIDCHFSIGFSFNPGSMAYFHTDNGVNFFLINPTDPQYNKKDIKEKFYVMLWVAIHEIVHYSGYRYHSEDFCLTFEDLSVKVLLKLKNWKKIVDDSKKDVL